MRRHARCLPLAGLCLACASLLTASACREHLSPDDSRSSTLPVRLSATRGTPMSQIMGEAIREYQRTSTGVVVAVGEVTRSIPVFRDASRGQFIFPDKTVSLPETYVLVRVGDEWPEDGFAVLVMQPDETAGAYVDMLSKKPLRLDWGLVVETEEATGDPFAEPEEDPVSAASDADWDHRSHRRRLPAP